MYKYLVYVLCLLMGTLCLSTGATAKEFSMRSAALPSGGRKDKDTYFDAGIGAMLVPFSSYRGGFSFGIEAGEKVYGHRHSAMSVGLGIDYYPISKSGSAASQQAGSISYRMTGYALPVLVKGAYTYTVSDRIEAYAGIGLGMIASKVDTSISGFSSVSEQSGSFAFSVYPGIRVTGLGPGALFAELDFLSSSVNYLTTGPANIGGTLFLIGYNIFF